MRRLTSENVILVTCCSARKERRRHMSHYLKFQGLLEFVGRHLIESSCDLFRATHREENNVVPISLENVCSGSVATRLGEVGHYACV